MVDRKGKIKVAVMMGGFSSERPISLSTGKQILESLDREKYDVVGVDAALIAGSRLKTLQMSADNVEAVTEAGRALAASTDLVSVQETCEQPNAPGRMSRFSLSRQIWRGRHDPGPAGASGHPLHGVGCSGQRACDGQIDGQARDGLRWDSRPRFRRLLPAGTGGGTKRL